MRLTAALPAMLMIAGCDRASVDNRAPLWRAGEDLRYTSAAFADVLDIEVGINGTMYVLPSSLPQILVYNPDVSGGLQNTIGKGGVAAVELTRPAMLGSTAGLLWVYDEANQRVTLMRGNGEVAATNDALQTPAAPPDRVLQFDAIIRDGSIIARARPRQETDTMRAMPLLRFSELGAKLDTIGYVTREAVVMASELDGMIVVVDTAVSASNDSTAFRVTKMNLVGDTVYSIVWPYAGRASGSAGFSAAIIGHNGNIFVQEGDTGTRIRGWWAKQSVVSRRRPT